MIDVTALAERGYIPDMLIRMGIRSRLRERIRLAAVDDSTELFLAMAAESPIALSTDEANEQHYMLPPAFFERVLGPRLKYSCCYYDNDARSLADAEVTMLTKTMARAKIRDGMDILELGCGWGSLTIFLAQQNPMSTIHAVSNSTEQRQFIEGRCNVLGISNVRVTTADINDFQPDTTYDRIVSVEMFEHVRNHRVLLDTAVTWLKSDGLLFVHVFCHKDLAYRYNVEGPKDWMARYFFTDGCMPSFDLIPQASDAFTLEDSWRVSGTHYARTCRDWLSNMDGHRSEIEKIFRATYGPKDAMIWINRWRIFFMACEELFAYRGGGEWFVAHYLMRRVG